MDEALLLLLEKKDYDYITVKEICEKAGVNRSTFYLHYETTDDLMRESMEFIFSKFTERYSGIDFDAGRIGGESLERLRLMTPDYIIPYLEFLKEYRRYFMIALKKPEIFGVGQRFDDIYKSVFEPILMRFRVDERERKFIMAYHIVGMHAVIVEWIRSGCAESAEYIAGLLMKYTSETGQ